MAETVYTHILVLTSDFKVSDTIGDDDLAFLRENCPNLFSPHDILPQINDYTKFDSYEEFLQEIITMRDKLKTTKLKLQADIKAVLYNDDETASQCAVLRFVGNKIKAQYGTFRLIFNPNDEVKPKKKMLSLDEKLQLVAAWHKDNPNMNLEENTKYNGFMLGKFVKKAVKDAEVKARVDQILEDN